ncbi:MAG: type II toxin-antitoxin system VapC family toxin [Myxococcales bacterium]|nr:type II toxin-antitoxin system VapC family toxin [Myxococcales bacterium]
MRLLVDTHCWLWALGEPARLAPAAAEALALASNEVHFSPVVAWEIVIKVATGKLKLPGPVADYLTDRLRLLGHRTLAVDLPHVLQVGQLPLHHRDPFDRLLVAQAQVEGLTLVTADPAMRDYDVPLLWAAHGEAARP